MIHIQRECIIYLTFGTKSSFEPFLIGILTIHTVLIAAVSYIHSSPDIIFGVFSHQCYCLTHLQSRISLGKIIFNRNCDTTYHVINQLNGTHIHHCISINLLTIQKSRYCIYCILSTYFIVQSHGMSQRNLNICSSQIRTIIIQTPY